jgi:hypothetical protein
MRQALQSVGLAGRPRRQAQAGRHIGYLEAHIEQGDTLESGQLKVGIVTSIVGIWQYRINFAGAQNHAGTTRMAIRRDAGLALARFCVAIDEIFPKVCGPRTVWTTGRITLDPGAPSIIPGGAEMLFQIRDVDPAVIARLDLYLSPDTGPMHLACAVGTPSVTGTGRYIEPSGTRDPRHPTPAYESVASTTTCNTINTSVKTARLTCRRMRVAELGRRICARPGCESTRPMATKRTSRTYAERPAARPMIHGALRSPDTDRVAPATNHPLAPARLHEGHKVAHRRTVAPLKAFARQRHALVGERGAGQRPPGVDLTDHASLPGWRDWASRAD